MPTAITRQVSPRFCDCELTHLERIPINLEIARAQHDDYTQALEKLNCHIIELPAEPDFPDSVFVEDTAVILPEAALVTRPGAQSRRGEIKDIAATLRPYRELIYVREPATVDGGDVLVIGHEIFVGLSTRSGLEAVTQMQEALGGFGYRVTGLPLYDCLHLKSAVTALGPDAVLINPRWVETGPFAKYERVEISPGEPFAANILMIGDSGIYPTAFPETQRILEKRGVPLITVDVSEIAKAEGAVTCCSLIL